MYICVKIFHGIEYPDASCYKSCLLLDLNGVCLGGGGGGGGGGGVYSERRRSRQF